MLRPLWNSELAAFIREKEPYRSQLSDAAKLLYEIIINNFMFSNIRTIDGRRLCSMDISDFAKVYKITLSEAEEVANELRRMELIE